MITRCACSLYFSFFVFFFLFLHAKIILTLNLIIVVLFKATASDKLKFYYLTQNARNDLFVRFFFSFGRIATMLNCWRQNILFKKKNSYYCSLFMFVLFGKIDLIGVVNRLRGNFYALKIYVNLTFQNVKDKNSCNIIKFNFLISIWMFNGHKKIIIVFIRSRAKFGSINRISDLTTNFPHLIDKNLNELCEQINNIAHTQKKIYS